MGFDPGQIQVLSPVRKRDAGTISLNKRLQEALNPHSEDKREKEYGQFLFREGDRVMQIRNNYDILWKKSGGGAPGSGIFNGDIGRIVSIDGAKELMTVDFEDRIAEYPFEALAELEPAYAMTVHKSQGSEFPAVILSVTKGAPLLMTRGVLYTAVTRARELLILVGDAQLVEEMARNDRRQRRYSGLRARLSDRRQTG
jgi:exodeoxyribonuclease V alpha subunit